MIPEQNVNQEQNQIEFRCPQCLKLYQVQRQQIFSAQPEFHCKKCSCRFTFDYDSNLAQNLTASLKQNSKPVQTRTLLLPQARELERLSIQKKMTPNSNLNSNSSELVSCAKCQSINPRTAQECFKCGVILEKAAMIAKDKKIRVMPSLLKLWQELLNDYANIAKHVEFVDRCEDLHALPFALKKYKDLKETQPQDELAHRMFDSVIMKAISDQAKKYKKTPLMRRIYDLPWANIFRISPIVLGGAMMVAGLLHFEARNLAGAGVALLVLTLGFTYLHFGRLRLDDFWRD